MKASAIHGLFQAIDNFDTEHLVSSLTDDAVFRFGNVPPVMGKDNIRPFLNGFFQSIKGIHHDNIEVWEAENARIMNGRVTYTRHDGSKLSVFFSNTFKLEDDKIKEYLIFVDTSALYS